jgi:outer membrane immunogenic protein
MKRSILVMLGGLVVATGIVPANAADMPLKFPPFAPPVSTNPWSGFYLGANVGGAPDFALDGANVRSWIGGFQLGYNYQIDWFVVGVEGNFDWAGMRNNFSCGASACFAEPEWFATAVGRIGGAFGSALFYVDGGAAWTRDTVTDVFASDSFLGSQIRPGWTVGAGIEYQLSHNWSVKVEYDYMNFGARPITLAGDLGNSIPQDVYQTNQLIKVGFNYRFNGSGLGGSMPVMSYAPDSRWTQAGEDESPKTIRAFSSFAVGKDSADGVVGGLFALTSDLGKSGPRLYIASGAGWYQFSNDTGAVNGVYSTGDVLGGYGFVGKNYEVNLLAGLSAENDILSALDPTDPVHGTQGGVKVRADISANPTPKTLFEAEGEYATTFSTYRTSAKFGYDFFGKEIFIGPQVAAFGDARFNQWQVGVSISQIKMGKFELDISAGYAHDSSVGDGAFADIGLTTDF